MRSITILILTFSLFQNLLYGQTGLKGRILDESGLPLPGVTVLIENLNKGTSTNPEGYFSIELEHGDYTMLISSIGYKAQSIHFSIEQEVVDLKEIQLVPITQIMDEVVISGSRSLQKITESPAAIDLITAAQFEDFIGSPEELFGLQKGVDFARQGNFWGSISIRGFNSAFNQKMLLLDDNRIANIRIRTPVGPMSPFVKEDVERVEIVLGPSSALYGPNCLNGLFNTTSKSPFEYPGTDIVLGAGSNSLLNARIRHAYKINNKWAYKLTFEYLSGVEEDFTDSVYIQNQTTKVLEGKAEVGLQRDVLYLKGVASVNFKPTEKSEIGINYAFNKADCMNGVVRGSISNWLNSSLQVSYNSPNWFVQVYKTWIIMDQNISTIARTRNYYNLLTEGQSEEVAYTNSIYGPRRAVSEEDSYRLNGEIQYNNHWGKLEFVAGTQYQHEVAFSNHTYLLDEDGPIRLYQVGIYGQAIYDIGSTGLKVIATARADNHSLFGFNFLPRTGITYTKNQSTWRLTFGEGYSNPTLINTYFASADGTTLGNSDGFTLSDGTKLAPLEPERIKTLEIGYKSPLWKHKLFLDMDAYYNWVENMIGPFLNIAPNGKKDGSVVTYRGDRPITDFTQGAPGAQNPGEEIYSQFNYGVANTYGFDIGLNYYFTNNYSLSLNYSFFDFDIDRSDPKNDVNGDKIVNDNDMAINTPKNKISSAFNAKIKKFYGSLYARWIQKYDFFSGRNVAAATNPENIYNNTPVIEGQRVGGMNGQWNYGPLGGFYLSVNGNYQITEMFNVGIYVNNILGQGNYEFISSPPTETTFGAEIKVSLWKN